MALNDHFTRILGYTHADLPNLERWWLSAYPDPQYRHGVKQQWQTATEHAPEEDLGKISGEFRVTCKDGTERIMFIGAASLDDGHLVSFIDITEHKRAEEALDRERTNLRAIVHASPVATLVLDGRGRAVDANPALEHLFGCGIEQWQGRKWGDLLNCPNRLVHPQGCGSAPDCANCLFSQAIEEALTGRIPIRDREAEAVLVTDGLARQLWLRFSIEPFELNGQPHIIMVLDDLSERKRAEEAINFERRQLLSIFDSLNIFIYVADPQTYEILFVNQRLRELIGTNPVGELCYQVLQGKREPCSFCTNTIILNNNGLPYKWEHHNPITHVDVEIVDRIIRWPDGREVRLEFALDITERKRAEEALRTSEEKLRSLFAAMQDVIFVLDAEGRYLEIAPTNASLLYRPSEELLGKTLSEVFPPEKAAEFFSAIHRVLATGKSLFLDYSLTATDGRELWFSAVVAPMTTDRVIWIARNITDRKLAEKEREKLQGQLLQSQKLEAIGVLAGGVAHDFNNMLGVIIGYTELILGAMDETDPLRRNLQRILDAAQRSAGLTRQLLAFARKQTVAPVVLDLNESVVGMLKMLRRLIGENISLAWLPGPNPCTVRIDPIQLDQLLANLCVNARDAIGDIGKITIETATVTLDETFCRAHAAATPGNYVLLTVNDDGCGMDKTTLDHIFEPFFTTKELGQGTGLGLATVYGIVSQNEGLIIATSEPGAGTTFQVYLPFQDVQPDEAALAGSKDIPISRGETVLLVEDDPNLLEMSMMMLDHLGYTVLSAATPSEALRLAQDKVVGIDLLLTDVVMPEMNGRDLADQLKKLQPAMRHLFMSGYTANVIAHRGILDKGFNFIHKPFSVRDLAVKLRKVLDEPQA
ncbi:PAS domain S-box protein [Desulfobulbus propionicus]